MEENPKFNILDTTATQKIFELKKRIRAISGGTAASKTISILIWLIDYCQQKQERNKLATVVSESYPHLEKGAMLDFETIMKDRGYWNDKLWNKTKHQYSFEAGNVLEFFSVDTYGKAHGPRRDVLFVNECNNLAYNIVDQLITRTREVIWLDWNPSEEFWFYTEMQPNRDDIDFITLTYKDNEALDLSTVAEIESHRHNKAWWTVYGLGQLGQLENRIYTNWQILDAFPAFPHEARLWRYGLDLGYTNDPAACGAIYEYNGGYIIDEIFYMKGMSNKQIADFLLTQPRALIVADSAEPKSIDEIKSYGLTIVPSDKGKDSVLHGIQFVQDQAISITKRSLNFIKEYRNYLWMMDRDGKIINEPSDIFNHGMDAIRYAMTTGKRSKWTPSDPGGVKPFFEGIPA
jgi:phage terminase large subunit